MANFKLRIITPNKQLYENDVNFVLMRTVNGDLGIMAGHTPLTTVLANGRLIIRRSTEELEAAVFEGYAEITGTAVTILSDNAEWPDEIDTERAAHAKERAEKRLTEHLKDTDIPRAHLALQRALVRLDVAAYRPKR